MKQSDYEVVITDEIPVKDNHPYNGKIIGWIVVGRRSEKRLQVSAPTLFEAREKLYKEFELVDFEEEAYEDEEQ